jgi:hypothetical protein
LPCWLKEIVWLVPVKVKATADETTSRKLLFATLDSNLAAVSKQVPLLVALTFSGEVFMLLLVEDTPFLSNWQPVAVPALTLTTYQAVDVPPSAVNVTSDDVSDEELVAEVVSVIGVEIPTLTLFEVESPRKSVATRVIRRSAASRAVPLITPVEGFKVRPFGSPGVDEIE